MQHLQSSLGEKEQAGDTALGKTWPGENQSAAPVPQFPHQQNNNGKISFLVRSIPPVPVESGPACGGSGMRWVLRFLYGLTQPLGLNP